MRMFSLMGALVCLWLGLSAGLTSSNDGSTLALARAIGLKGQTTIDEDMALTLGVDRAFYDGHHYSDRPPGTAFLALPAVMIGDRWDPILYEWSRQREAVIISSTGANYAATYAARFPTSRPLWTFQGTSIAIRIHCALISLMGLFFLGRTCRMLNLSDSSVLFCLGTLGASSLWGVYSGMLFGHLTAAASVSMVLWGVARARTKTMTPMINLMIGVAAGWAMITDFLLLTAIAPLLVILLPRRFWLLAIAGLAMAIFPAMLYHYHAFDSPFSIGYDHHANFDFARGRHTNFEGSFWLGLWYLIGWGKNAGILAQSPILALSIVGLASTKTERFQPAIKMVHLTLLSFAPWFFLLCMHQTPFGGGTSDHRYLLPAFPVLGLGLALFWDRWLNNRKVPRVIYGGVGLLFGLSAYGTWTSFLLWRG